MRAGFSLLLDLTRIAAAVVVFLAHFSYDRLSGGWLEDMWAAPFAHHAVIVFFVLSGLVIAYAASVREASLQRFVRARLVRLYSVVLPMIVLVPALDWIGHQWDPSLYDGWWFDGDDPLKRVLAAALFLHESWWTSARYFSNGPYWSIAYEFWYYAAFGALWFLAGIRRWLALAAVTLAAGPKIALLFPVWLLGVGVWHLCRRYTMPPAAAAGLLAAAVAGYVLYVVTGAYQELEDAGLFLMTAAGVPAGDFQWSEPWLAYYVLGVLVAGGFIALHGLSDPLERLLAPAAGAIRWVAGATFTMYLMHYPLMHVIATVLPGETEDPYRALAILMLTLIGVFAIAAVTERRRDLFGSAYDYLVAKLAALAWLMGARVTPRRAAEPPLSKHIR